MSAHEHPVSDQTSPYADALAHQLKKDGKKIDVDYTLDNEASISRNYSPCHTSIDVNRAQHCKISLRLLPMWYHYHHLLRWINLISSGVNTHYIGFPSPNRVPRLMLNPKHVGVQYQLMCTYKSLLHALHVYILLWSIKY